MRPESVDELIFCLEQLANHPDRIRGVVPVGQEESYMLGFAFALRFGICMAHDGGRERELRHRAAEVRGWAIDRDPKEQMLERDFSPDKVLAELARIEIEFIRLATA